MPRVCEGLAGVEHFELGELIRVRLHQIAHAPHDPAALGRGQTAPDLGVECLLRGARRTIRMLAVPGRHLRNDLAGGRIVDL